MDENIQNKSNTLTILLSKQGEHKTIEINLGDYYPYVDGVCMNGWAYRLVADDRLLWDLKERINVVLTASIVNQAQREAVSKLIYEMMNKELSNRMDALREFTEAVQKDADSKDSIAGVIRGREDKPFPVD